MKVLYRKSTFELPVAPEDTILSLRRRAGDLVGLHWTRIELRAPAAAAAPADADDNKPAVRLSRGRASAMREAHLTLSFPQVTKYTGDLKTLKSLSLSSASSVEVKDLGPQFSYRGVFLIEYAGPIAIVLAYTLRPAFLFGGAGPLNVAGALTRAGMEAAAGTPSWNRFVQALGVVLWVAHFAKRELETCAERERTEGGRKRERE